MTKLTAGAWRLYCFLARCRNQSTGKCCPSVNLTMETLGINRGTVYALRKELQGKSWATFDGNSATDLFGFGSPKIQTADKSEKSDSLNIQTTIEESKRVESDNLPIESEKSDSPKIQTPNTENKELGDSLKNQTISHESEKSDSLSENSDFLSEKSDCHIGRTSKENQQRRTSKKKRQVDSPLVLEVFQHWQSVLDHPKAILDDKREKIIQDRLDQGFSVDDLKSAIDGCRASPYHMGDNDQKTVYDSLALICRDADHVERFIAKSKNGNGHSNGHANVANMPAWKRQLLGL